MNNVCTLLNIKQIFSSPYHHETIGALESNHRTLNEFLLSFVNGNERDKWISYFTFASTHVDTSYSPYELVYGN